MPKPVFIITAQGISEDHDSRLVTAFSIIEKIQVAVLKAGDSPEPRSRPSIPVNFGVNKTIAVWKRTPGDSGLFGHEFVIRFEDQERRANLTEFEFPPNADLKRFMLTMQGFPVPKESGDVFVVSRIRKKGGEQWMSQEYPIAIEVITPESLSNS